mmetsp:Transcript_28494/g.61420  ORF Transcript_28494/g.61420 Transcript_28494/m.61420 type:complete len:249 (+) Transcript_28494:345-1091(+)
MPPLDMASWMPRARHSSLLRYPLSSSPCPSPSFPSPCPCPSACPAPCSRFTAILSASCSPSSQRKKASPAAEERVSAKISLAQLRVTAVYSSFSWVSICGGMLGPSFSPSISRSFQARCSSFGRSQKKLSSSTSGNSMPFDARMPRASVSSGTSCESSLDRLSPSHCSSRHSTTMRGLCRSSRRRNAPAPALARVSAAAPVPVSERYSGLGPPHSPWSLGSLSAACGKVVSSSSSTPEAQLSMPAWQR